MGARAMRTAGERIGHLRESASDYAVQGRKKAHQMERALQKFVREQPIKSALLGASFVAAIGVGVLVGRLWLNRDKTQWMRRFPWQ